MRVLLTRNHTRNSPMKIQSLKDLEAIEERANKIDLEEVLQILNEEYQYYRDKAKKGDEIHRSIWRAQGIKEVANIINRRFKQTYEPTNK